MKYAIIENGLVTNMVLSESLSFAEAQGWVVANDEVEIGHSYVDSSFVTPVPTPKTDDELAAEVRADRDIRLVEVDDVAGNALRWSALDADKQATWATYRQALLDVPQQADFPTTVVWPVKPEGE
jgi:hypothetical protein